MTPFPRWAVVEYVKGGLPVRVCCHCHDDPLEPRDGETVRWLIGDLPDYACARLATARGRQIVRWCGGEKPSWLSSHVSRLPSDYGRGKGRAVISIMGEEVTPYVSMLAAAMDTGIDRRILYRRLADGRPDGVGRLWRDAQPRCAASDPSTASMSVGAPMQNETSLRNSTR
jgi:hypothetical protein